MTIPVVVFRLISSSWVSWKLNNARRESPPRGGDGTSLDALEAVDRDGRPDHRARLAAAESVLAQV